MLPDPAFITVIRRNIKDLARQFIGKILLFHVMIGIVVSILIAVPMSQLRSPAVMAVP